MADVFPPYNLPNEAVPWGREAQKRILAGESSEAQLTQKVDNGLRAVSGQLTTLAEQVNSMGIVVTGLDAVVQTLNQTVATLDGVVAALPYTVSETVRQEGGSLTGSWATVATVNIARPAGKTRVSVTGFGNASYTDTVSGGLTNAYLRIVINGTASGAFVSSKNEGVSASNNAMSGAFSREYAAPSTVTVQLQAYSLNGSAFPALPSNYANITALATFS